MTQDKIIKFIDDVQAGKIDPTYKSDPIPEENDGPVTVVVGKSFEEIVMDKEKDVFVKYYAPWCGHCQQLEPTWEKLAKILKGVVKVGAVNADEEKQLGGQYQIQGFPTIKFFGFNKKKDPETYQGGRDAESMANYAQQKVSQGVKHRLKGKDSSSGSKSQSSDKKASQGAQKK